MIYYTTIEQAEHLVELGLDPETADMFYFLDPTPAGNIYHLAMQRIDIGVRNLPKYNDGDLPCWSIGALLELMPESYQLTRGKDNKYQFMLFHILIHDWFNTPLEAVYNMVCYLLENGYIKKA